VKPKLKANRGRWGEVQTFLHENPVNNPENWLKKPWSCSLMGVFEVVLFAIGEVVEEPLCAHGRFGTDRRLDMDCRIEWA